MVHTATGPLADEVQRCTLTLADEVQRCTLRSGASKEDWRDTWRRRLARHLAQRIGEKCLEKRVGNQKKEEKEEEEKEILIKSGNPHLPGSWGKNNQSIETWFATVAENAAAQ